MLRCRPMLSTRAGAGLRVLTRTANSSALQEMPPCDFTPQRYTGPPIERLLELREKHVSPASKLYYKRPLLVHQGHKQYYFDQDGKRYLDMWAGTITVAMGHCHPKLNEALEKQSKRLWHSGNNYLHPNIHEYSEKLASTLPGDLNVVFYCNSGSEANDLAFTLARMYTGNWDIVAIRNSFHGQSSPAVVGASCSGGRKFPNVGNSGSPMTLSPNVYQGPWGGNKCRYGAAQALRECDCSTGYCHASEMYANDMKDLMMQCVPWNGVAGFCFEAIQGGGGIVPLPKGYLKAAFELIRENGGICISDEVQSGFGRTGSHFWAFEASGVVPDIVTVAKAIGNGFPMAAVITTKEIADTIKQVDYYYNTFGGNALACAVASAALDVIEEDGLQENARRVGDVLLQEMMSLRDEFEIVGDVRGQGLMLGMELIKNKETKIPLPVKEVAILWEDCKDHGVLFSVGGLHKNVLRIEPPLVITEADAYFAIAVLKKTLQDTTNRISDM